MNFAKRSSATCCGKKSKPAGGTPAAGTCSQHGSRLREFSWKRATRKVQGGKNEVAQKLKSWCGGKDSNLHGIATASPSSWCVCQFRHHRKIKSLFLFAAQMVVAA
jgi:hypothetical protein